MLNGKKIALILAVILVAQLALTAVLCVRLFGVENTALVDFTVVIDAGHGGVDGGVVSKNGTKESDLNLLYAKTLGEILKNSGFNVKYTRTNKGGLYGLPTTGFKRRDMETRRQLIANSSADLVISIHMNKFSDSNRKGPQVFFQEDSIMGELLANSIQTAFNKFSGNSHEAIAGDFYICRTSTMPAVIVECGFLSNPAEEAMLLEADYRTNLMETVFSGMMLYLYSL